MTEVKGVKVRQIEGRERERKRTRSRRTSEADTFLIKTVSRRN